MSKKGIVKIHGKEYKTVALRVNEFHGSRSDTMRINTKLIYHDTDRVVMKAIIYDSDVAVATGYAEENRSQGNINKTSAMENAETGAIGRALACYGLGGDEYASADEVLRAISQQDEINEKPATKPPQPEPATEDAEQKLVIVPSEDAWTSSIPDDILDLVKANYGAIQDRGGKAKEWHTKTLKNLLDTKVEEGQKIGDAISGLGREQLEELLGYQKIKIGENNG